MAREQGSALSYSYNTGYVVQYNQGLGCLQEEDVPTAIDQDLAVWARLLARP